MGQVKSVTEGGIQEKSDYSIVDSFVSVKQNGWSKADARKQIRDENQIQQEHDIIIGMAARYAKNTQTLSMIEGFRDRLQSADSAADQEKVLKKIKEELSQLAAQAVKRHNDLSGTVDDSEALISLSAKAILKALDDGEFGGDPFKALSSLERTVSRDRGHVSYEIFERLPKSKQLQFLENIDLKSKEIIAARLIQSDSPEALIAGMKIVNSILAADKDNPYIAYLLAQHNIYGKGANPEEGMKILGQGLESNPKDPTLLAFAGNVHSTGFKDKSGKVIFRQDFDLAVKFLDDSLTSDPKNRVGLLVKARLMHGSGDFVEAIDLANRLINSCQEPKAYTILGKIYRDGFTDRMEVRQQNNKLAHDYFIKAASLGDKEAKEILSMRVRSARS